jgi:voltage-gated potassium channel
MQRTVRRLVKDTWESEANLSVFLGLLVLIVFVLPSLGFDRNGERFYTDISYTVITGSGVAIAWRSRRALFIVGTPVAIVAILLRWANWFVSPHALGLWPVMLALVSIALILTILLSQVFSVGPVTSMRIQGAIAIYLCFGIAWAHLFHITAAIIPASFIPTDSRMVDVRDWVYYSFITLTTVGYGDIVPVKPVARSLATSEAVTGQLYLAVLLAHLVSMRVSGIESRTRK